MDTFLRWAAGIAASAFFLLFFGWVNRHRKCDLRPWDCTDL